MDGERKRSPFFFFPSSLLFYFLSSRNIADPFSIPLPTRCRFVVVVNLTEGFVVPIKAGNFYLRDFKVKRDLIKRDENWDSLIRNFKLNVNVKLILVDLINRDQISVVFLYFANLITLE